MLWKRIISGPFAASLAIVIAATHLPTRAGEAATTAGRSTSRASVEEAISHLNPSDVALYRQIFALQEAGDWARADSLIGQLGDRVLLGHVLYQRYMHPFAYRSTYQELERWLEQFADHPDADRVYDLARRRRPAGAHAPSNPVRGYLAGAGQELQERGEVPYRTTLARAPAEDALVRDWQKKVARLAGAGRLREAAAELRRQKITALLDRVEVDLARWTLARGHFDIGDHAGALSLAGKAAARSGQEVPEIHWTAGISAWRLGRTRLAAQHFVALANAEGVLPAERARAAFWAARAYLVDRRPQLVGHYLNVAAAGHDFYGLLARKILGASIADDREQIALQASALQVLLSYPGARRAIALGQIGQFERAEREIRKLAARATPELMVGLIALAKSLDLPAAQMRLAQSLGSRDGQYDLGALFPVPSWRPSTGYTLDRALVFAIMRAESAFDPSVESYAGARGLMQVMPATAKYIAAKRELQTPGADALFEPETSIQLGQAYLEHLLQHARIGDNVIFVAAAYNAGPGRVLDWRDRLDAENDPLLFLESIPMREPRVYVKKVLTNLWSYRARLGQAQPSLQAMVRSQWPSYQALDPRPQLHAWN